MPDTDGAAENRDLDRYSNVSCLITVADSVAATEDQRMGQKTLLLVRHAKSCWEDERLADVDRPLNARGLANAPEMGQRLLRRKQVPGLIISSSAVRTLATATLITAELSYPPDDIVVAADLYHGTDDDVFCIVEGLADVLQTVMLVIHNPTITDIAKQFAVKDIQNVPTCGVLTMAAGSWSGFRDDATLLDFDYPKARRANLPE